MCKSICCNHSRALNVKTTNKWQKRWNNLSLHLSLGFCFYVLADWHRVMSESRRGQTPLVESWWAVKPQTKRLSGSGQCGGTSSASMCLLGHHLRGKSCEFGCCHGHLLEKDQSYLSRQQHGGIRRWIRWPHFIRNFRDTSNVYMHKKPPIQSSPWLIWKCWTCLHGH